MFELFNEELKGDICDKLKRNMNEGLNGDTCEEQKGGAYEKRKGNINEGLKGGAYEEKVCFLLDHKVAVWDIIYSANRVGALDADIENEKPNDIPGLLLAYPRIKRILLAGRKAEKSFHKHFPNIKVDTVYVPSTSPAYAKKSLTAKIKDWRRAITD